MRAVVINHTVILRPQCDLTYVSAKQSEALNRVPMKVLVKRDLVEDTTVVGGDADAAAVTASLRDTRTLCGGKCPSPHHAA